MFLPGAADDDAFPQPEGEAVLDMASPFAAPVGGGEGNDGVRGDKVGDIMFAEESAFVGVGVQLLQRVGGLKPAVVLVDPAGSYLESQGDQDVPGAPHFWVAAVPRGEVDLHRGLLCW
jgi:hypothetical protein